MDERSDEFAARGRVRGQPVRPYLLAAVAATLLVATGIIGSGFTTEPSQGPSGTPGPASNDSSAPATPGMCMTALVPSGGPIAALRTELAVEPLLAWGVDGAVIIGSAGGAGERRVELPTPRLTTPGGNSSWSPTGEWLAIEVQFETYPPGSCADVLLVRVDGTVLRASSGLANVLSRMLAWSPDGMEVMYQQYEPLVGGRTLVEIHARSLASGVDRVLTTVDCPEVGALVVSADVRRLALECEDRFLIIDAANGDVSEVTPQAPGRLLGWSQDPGGLLLRDRPLRVVDAETGATRRSLDVAWADEIARAHGIPVSWLDPDYLGDDGSFLRSDGGTLMGIMSAGLCPEGECPNPDDGYEQVSILYLLDTNTGALQVRASPIALYGPNWVATPAGDAVLYSVYGNFHDSGTFLVGLDGGEPQRISAQGDELIRLTTSNQ